MEFDFNLNFDMDFNLDGFDVDFSKEESTENGFCQPKVLKPKRVVYDNAELMAKEIEVKKDMHVYSIVSGNFIFGDLLEAMIVNQGIPVNDLYICTLSLSENNVDSMVNIMLSGQCKHLHLIVSSYFYSHERNNLIKYIYDELENQEWGFTMSVAGTHMKLALIQTDDLNITMQGSANLRSSRNIEQFSIIENQELFDFNKDYIDVIEESYQINKKSGDRGGKLWHQVQKKLQNPEKPEKESQARQSNGE